MTLTPGHMTKFTHGIFFPDHYLSLVRKMGMILHAIVVHDQGVVVAGGVCPGRTCLVNYGKKVGSSVAKFHGALAILFSSDECP